MIAPFGNGRLVRAAQDEIALLKQQVAALLAQGAALATQIAAEAERAALAEAQALVMRERVDTLEAAATLQASTTDRQAGSLEELRELSNRNEEAVKQGRGNLARVEKQIDADMAELRRLNVDIATTMLQYRGEALSS